MEVCHLKSIEIFVKGIVYFHALNLTGRNGNFYVKELSVRPQIMSIESSVNRCSPELIA